ncbi:MAG: hypothetical protein ABR562_00320 [Thermoplasmatota archaeon]|nr:hypothetical protein [Halobacteriales archaeon]
MRKVSARTWILLLLASSVGWTGPLPDAQAQTGWSTVVNDAVGDPALTTDCTAVCANGADPAVDLVGVAVRQNATHVFLQVSHAPGSHTEVPFSSPPAFNSYLFFDVDGHTWEVMARQGEPFQLVRDPQQEGGDVGADFSFKGAVDGTGALDVAWGGAPNSYEAGIATRVFARADGPPPTLRVTKLWLEMYGHKGNAGSYHDRAPDTGDVSTPLAFQPLAPRTVAHLTDGAWKLDGLDPDGTAPSAAFEGDALHVAYLKARGTPTGAAGLYHAKRTGATWSFERLGDFAFAPASGQEPNATTSIAWDDGALWIADSSASGMELWRNEGSGWKREDVPSPDEPWDRPPAFVPSFAAFDGHAVFLGRANGTLYVLERQILGWNVTHLFPGAENGLLALGRNGTMHVVWHASGGLARLHYASSADRWLDHALPVRVPAENGTAPVPFALAVGPDGAPALAWTNLDFGSGAPTPQLWAARVRNGTLASTTLVAVAAAELPDTYVQAAFDGTGRLGILHGHAQAEAYAVVRWNGTTWNEPMAGRELAGLAFHGTELASAHVVHGAGVFVATRAGPGANAFAQALNKTFIPSQPAAAPQATATPTSTPSSTTTSRHSSMAGLAVLFVLAGSAFLRRRA